MSPERRTAVEVEGHRLVLSNLEKELYPSGFTKGDVVAYYARVAPVLLPHLRGRPVTVVRFPDGTGGPSFFEKRVPRGAPGWVRTVTVPTSPEGGGTLVAPVIEDVATLVWMANLAALELHVPMWSASGGVVGPVDTMVLDLDPGEPATVVACCEVARLARQELDAAGLTGLPKTSGAKGLQVYVPLDPPQAWEPVHRAARGLATRLERARPDLVVSTMRRSARQGRVLLDWSQNHPAKTTVAPYSLRAGSSPTVSTPVTWDELAACEAAGDPRLLVFGPEEVLRRVEEMGDLFERSPGPAPSTRRDR